MATKIVSRQAIAQRIRCDVLRLAQGEPREHERDRGSVGEHLAVGQHDAGHSEEDAGDAGRNTVARRSRRGSLDGNGSIWRSEVGHELTPLVAGCTLRAAVIGTVRWLHI
jgi:hypothetical protein